MAVAVGVRVRFLARLRELAGVDVEPLMVQPGSSVSDVYGRLRDAHPALPARDGVRAAVNQEFTEWERHVVDGDEVAFIPPVSGGGR